MPVRRQRRRLPVDVPYLPPAACRGGVAHSGLAPESRTTFAHLASSPRRNSTVCSGEVPIASAPIWLKLSTVSGAFSPFTTALLARLTISRGVPAGADSTYQVLTT